MAFKEKFQKDDRVILNGPSEKFLGASGTIQSRSPYPASKAKGYSDASYVVELDDPSLTKSGLVKVPTWELFPEGMDIPESKFGAERLDYLKHRASRQKSMSKTLYLAKKLASRNPELMEVIKRWGQDMDWGEEDDWHERWKRGKESYKRVTSSIPELAGLTEDELSSMKYQLQREHPHYLAPSRGGMPSFPPPGKEEW